MSLRKLTRKLKGGPGSGHRGHGGRPGKRGGSAPGKGGGGVSSMRARRAARTMDQKQIEGTIQALEGAIGQISGNHDDGMRMAVDVIRGADTVKAAKRALVEASDDARRRREPGDYVDAFDTAYSLL